MKRLLAACACALISLSALAGNQKEERLAASVRNALHQAVSDAPPTIAIEDAAERDRWLTEMSRRLEKRVPDSNARKELLTTIHYEATRAGLDPQLVLALIQVESQFRIHVLSNAGARGYMQVMPFWVETIGNQEDNLLHMRTNLRYGCTILRHYIDLEKGNLFLALGRYNGSRGKPEYPNRINTVLNKQWAWTPLQTPTQVATKSPSPTPAPPSPASEPPPVTLPPVATAPVKPPLPVPANKPLDTSPQTAAVTPTPAPESARVEPSPPASRKPVRRDIVIVR